MNRKITNVHCSTLKLKKLSLGGNGIDNEGARHLGEALKHENNHITTL